MVAESGDVVSCRGVVLVRKAVKWKWKRGLIKRWGFTVPEVCVAQAQICRPNVTGFST